MIPQNCSAQQRRILNLIWASAGDYGFDPLFMAFTTDKKPDYYMNCMVGFVHKWFGEEMPRSLFASWSGDRRQAVLDDLTWLALEHAAYQRELQERPALADLRRDHATQFFGNEYLLSRQEWMAKNQLVYAMQAARWKEVLGQRLPLLSPREQGLYQALKCSGDLSPADLEQAIRKLLRDYLNFDGQIQDDSILRKQLKRRLSPLVERAIPKKMVRTDELKITQSLAGEDRDELIPVTFARGHSRLLTRSAVANDGQYIETCFGRSLYPRQELDLIEQSLCTGKHFGCHLWFTDGAPASGTAQTAETQHLAQQAAEQEKRNRQYYSEFIDLHRNSIRRITQQIRNCVLVHQRTDTDVTRRGRLDGSRVWREAVLEDGRVFNRWNEDPSPSFTVDVLLDGSASRLRCQETIAAQGYILSESLAQCGIPVRVSSFCSLRGYTVLRVLKDYNAKDSRQVFRYFAAGWNRDGLALRGMGKLLERQKGKRHLIILLTDASPSDSRKVPPTPDFPVSREYDGQTGIRDAADEIRTLRRNGVRVAAVFMGVNSSVPAAEQMFGSDLVRIQRMDQLAAAAGKLIQQEIQELSC